MKLRSIPIMISLLFVTACAGTRDNFNLTDPPEEATIHECLYEAMDETVQTKEWSWWEADQDNCSSSNANRGRILRKHTEVIQNKFCAEFFNYSQTHYDEGGWKDYDGKIITACRNNEEARWVIFQNRRILDVLLIEELLSK